MRKWVFIINNWNSTSLEVKKKYCRKGIPQQFRRKVWRLFLLGTKGAKGKAAERGKPYSYYSELPLEDTQLEGVIERDLDRTFPTHRKFDSGANGEGQQALRRMLRAYANYNRGVGYCQGMGFLAATLLLQINEEERAFWCFCSLMEEEEYNLKSLYEPGFPMLQCYFSVFEGLMKKTNKKVYHHVREVHGVESSYYATHWFLTLFTYYLNFGLISRIWDMFLCEGWKIIFRFALALLKIDQQRLLGAATETELLMVLKDIQENKEPAKMLDVSLKIKFTTKYMNKLKKSYLDSQQRKK
ncbi:rab-like GTPase activating protein [Angomonas deanei]|uniref:Rab-GTPase-TBC domain containing protein, putative n=1 Tax=Angomonas deanei TaxID=59799 RepID=S9V449_9TRYP|nr:rab-like GTPase activating protein [Angomonas deanei]EPY41781.1 rab-like GTPase activating protein [Angomonas deanei]CAD2213225.1 Rab-GTPase-TBC domain containing protein, putative [Angomonas deanei]|eukprot:EPY37877.1 rab-like GTPase activating protein [Angomonas deanei]